MTTRKLLLSLMLCITFVNVCKADSLKDLFGKISGDDISNVLGNIISKDSLTIKDLSGEWETTGPAVVFKSDEILGKAGGAAASATAEKKLKPYFTKLGLENSSMTIDKEGNVEFIISGKSIKGKLTPNSDESFSLKLGRSKITSKLGKERDITVYFRKSGKTLSMASNVKKMLEIVKKVGSFSSSVEKLANMLDQYEQICIGLKFEKQTGSKVIP